MFKELKDVAMIFCAVFILVARQGLKVNNCYLLYSINYLTSGESYAKDNNRYCRQHHNNKVGVLHGFVP